MKALRVRVRAWLDGRRAPLVIVLFTLAITIGSVRVGFYTDDHPFRAALHGQWPGGPPWWDLYRFATPPTNARAIEAGVLPWWTAPRLALHLLRPLGSALFALDDALFGANPLGWHLHSIAWYLALVAAAGWLLRGALGRVSGNLAMLIFAASVAHFHPWAWPSCRHTVLAALPVTLALGVFARDPRRGRFALALGLALGLLGGESALGVLPFALARVALDRSRRWRDRALDLAPAAAVLAAYVVVYARLGCGANDSDGYVDPTASPARFAARAALMFPIMLGNAITSVPAELANLGITTPLVAVGAASALGTALLVRASLPRLSDEERGALGWLVAGATLAILPGLGGFPGARTLLLPNLGFAALLAVVIRRASSAPSRGPRLAALALALVHVVLAPVIDLGNIAFNTRIARATESIAEAADLDASHRRAFFLGSADPMIGMYAPTVLYERAPERLACWSNLSGTKGAHRLTRSGPRSLVVRPLEGPFLRGPFETLFRTRALPVPLGYTARQCGATFVVTEVEGDRPRAVEVTLDVALDDPGVRLLAWRGGRLRALDPPVEGASIDVAAEPGPMGDF